MPEKEIDHEPPRWHRRDLLLWTGMLAGPLAWALQLQASYALAPTACATGNKPLLLGVALGCLLIALGGAVLAWTLGRRISPGSTEKGDPSATRIRFMAFAGVALSLTFALVILALAVPNLILRVCD